MTKRVFFSFHYDDVKTFRVNVVRNHGLTKETGQSGFFDASIWEDAELHGDPAVKRLINSNLENTTVTCVLIGTDTWERRWVRYEIMKSYDRGNSLLGIHINGIPDRYRQTFLKGKNPFDYLGFYINSSGVVNNYQESNDTRWSIYQDLTPNIGPFANKYWNTGHKLSNWIQCYDWYSDDGYQNFATWVENAK
ncbi:hypothetical protein A2767_03675 [Candidatus Roizmanbacteria bacterium RIFCSPHIGHO2_01_FULL_35_10]|uniref:Thoeris protein ThsB TIR-like domain-containing protein n=1 Tax=Candidatus Roizmanbacteria bacterium RIFCSPLOWO2_01_FULL_35_13 TaxID=1802055 RepID=A0A1F7IA31_9BACT|nr:MAG: hypothetical protein A2767_03675 [Candidatus Roizmanbacteria bacterium RIFCSPHIGHO2_01_FULL_35_10]OGK40225.1 MAG: hypothetical protein A3A74_06990 [Candidatus Roizmanbacteria bacterium RIFCSPLOWO2_01_FULL_35_13]